MIVTTADHPVMEFARTCESNPELSWIDLKDTAAFEYIFGPPNTVLGRVGRQALRDAGIEPIGQGTDLSASFAAAMAREGARPRLHLPLLPRPRRSFPLSPDRKKRVSLTSPLHGPPENTAPGQHQHWQNSFRRWLRSCWKDDDREKCVVENTYI